MYKLVSTYLKPKGLSQTFRDVDISLMTLNEIKTNYVSGYIELSNPALNDNIFLSIEKFKELKLPMRDNHTFEYWLTYIENSTITAPDIRPDYVSSLVKARNAIQADYKIDLCKRTAAPDTSLAIGDLNDVYVRKPNVDLDVLRTRSLTTVNGYLHPHIPYYDGIAVVGGGTLHKTLGDLRVGIWSFANVADIQMVAITEDMVNRYREGTPLANLAVIDLGINIEHKSLIVSIAGYPLLGSNIVHVLSDTTGVIKIDTQRLNLVDKISRAYGHINLEALGIAYDPDETSLKQFTASGIRSDQVARKLLSLPQSFIAVIDTPTLTIAKESIPITGLPDKLILPEEPNLPIVDSHGRAPEYWIKNQNGAHCISMPHDWYTFPLHETRRDMTYDRFNTASDVGAFFPHQYEFLKIVSVKLNENTA